MSTSAAQGKRVELYTHEPMTNWLSPSQLLKTGVRAAIASTIGSFLDSRSMGAALTPASGTKPLVLDAQRPTWLDFVADTGDGWDSTYSVAWSVSRDSLKVEGTAEPLPRANVLVLGGDQVYPTPAENFYRSHLVDPFRSALPAHIDEEASTDDPYLLAIPGNHDWYDGLRGFIALFCSQKPLGRWRTVQRTSYFAVQLPHGWWLWGLDLQLDAAMDTAQMEFFERVAGPKLQLGEQVILCVPDPSWLDESERLKATQDLRAIEMQQPRFHSLRSVEQLIADLNTATLALVLTGDRHHYARYEPLESTEGRPLPQRIICGGGGAYLSGTHDLPEELRFNAGDGTRERYRKAAAFPDAPTSRSLRNRAWTMALRNPVFCLELACAYLLYLWVLQSASKVKNPWLDGQSLMEYLAQVPLNLANASDTGKAIFHVMAHSPATVILTLAVLSAAGMFTSSGSTGHWRRPLLCGMVHGSLHLGLALATFWWMAHFNLNIVARGLDVAPAVFLDTIVHVALFATETALLGGVAGGLLFGTWLIVTNKLFGWHSEVVFSSQRIADYKCFLRMKLDKDGLVIFPIKIERVCKRWKLGAAVKCLAKVGRTWRIRASAQSRSRFEPVTPIETQMIEDIVRIPSNSPRRHPGT